MQEKPVNSPGILRRIVMFPVVRIVIAFLLVILACLLVQILLAFFSLEGEVDAFGRIFLPEGGERVSGGLALHAVLSTGLTLIVVYLAYAFYARRIERREVSDLAFPHAVKETGVGILVGAAAAAVPIAALALLGIYRAEGWNDASILVIPLTGDMISGFVEEILFRGVLFKVMEEYIGSWWALVVSALVFGLGHLLNPDANIVSALAIVAGPSVLLAAAYILTRRLWFSIGIHFAANFVEAGIFGLATGLASRGWLQGALQSPAWLGGGGNPAAVQSVISLGVTLAAGLILLAMAVRRKRTVPPLWKK
jgi:membrane protease YdiL (CAAX protease family)